MPQHKHLTPTNDESTYIYESDTKSFVNTPELIHCKDVSGFLEILNPLHPHWVSQRKSFNWIFRGHEDSTWPLLPAAWREINRPKLNSFEKKLSRTTKFDLLKLDIESEWNNTNGGHSWKMFYPSSKIQIELLRQTYFEILAVSDFVSLAQEVALQPPQLKTNQFDNILEDLPFREPYTNIHNGYPNEYTALAQHYGTPTRLLDWTRNPYIAAFFASQETSKHLEKGTDRDNLICVWALKTDPSFVKTFTPPLNLFPNIHAQNGLFTYIDEPITTHGGPLENWLHLDPTPGRHYDPNKVMTTKITLLREHRHELRRNLELLDIHKPRLMPGYGSIAETVEWRAKHNFP